MCPDHSAAAKLTTMKHTLLSARKNLLKASLLVTAALAFHAPAYAAGTPDIKPALKKMLGSLATETKQDLQKLVGALRETQCGGGLKGCYAAKLDAIQLYFYTSNNLQQTFIVVIDKDIPMPKLFSSKIQSVLGQSRLRSPMISISTSDFDLTTDRMPNDLKKIVNDNYFGVTSIPFSVGVQIAARINIGGEFKNTMESFGIKADQMTMRSAVVLPIPSDITGGAGAAAGIASDIADGATMTKAGVDAMKLEAFVEFQFAPGSRIPLLLPPVTLTDATFYINNNLTVGYKGNAAFQGLNDKKFLIQFQTPVQPTGAMDLADFGYRIATPARFTMEDAAKIMIAMATTDRRLTKYGGGLIGGIDKYKGDLLAAAKPLSMFQLDNPRPAPEYRFGDKTKPWPDDNKYYNIVSYGPLATGGPYMSQGSAVGFLGQKISWMDYTAGYNGLSGSTGNNITLKLGPLGKVTFRMETFAKVNTGTQQIGMAGNFAGQKVEVLLGTSKMSISVNASCVNPFEIKASADITPTLNIADVFEGHGGVNVDPSSITGCVGKELEAAYRKVAGEFSNLGGYSAAMANAELKKMEDAATLMKKQAEEAANKVAAESKKAAEDAARAAEKAAEDARKQYENAKNAARDVANKTANAASNAFRDAGNAFKRIGKKKKHKKGPDPKFAGSVFDWDYYYDHYPEFRGQDLAAHWKDTGFYQNRQGSLEFNPIYYYHRYADVSAQCPGSLLCATQHWLDYGIEMGRQGSADFNVVDYMNRYADVPRTLAPEDDPDALEHWLTFGADDGRDGSPTSKATTPFSPPMRYGGRGGAPWNDAAQCQSSYVVGFRIRANGRVDGIQFLYANGQWGAPHGNLGNPPYTYEIALPAGQYFTTVHIRSGDSVDALGLISNTGVGYGMFGGNGGTFAAYGVTSGEKLACVTGRSGKNLDQFIFSSTGQR
ncbi:hypothetical protein D3C72_150930 [compost metagenome]